MGMEKKYLSDIPAGESCIILKINGHGGFRHRILELGFVRGQKVQVIKNAPLQDPIEYKVLNSLISLRRSEAKRIEVIDITQYQNSCEGCYFGTITEDANIEIQKKLKTINVALVGNPNCGKTSLFNLATGLHEKVGNYAGVTVGAKEAVFYQDGYTINLVDLPGTYSITEYTPEELYVRHYLLDEVPDVVLNVVDASNLERNLFLTTQLIDMNVKMVCALNMYDELQKSGDTLDYDYLGKMLGFPIIPTIAAQNVGIKELFDTIIDVYENRERITKHIHINYGNTIEHTIASITQRLKSNEEIVNHISARYVAIKMIEGDKTTDRYLREIATNYNEIAQEVAKRRQIITTEYKEDCETVITNLKYGFIKGALKETFTQSKKSHTSLAERIDDVLTNKWLGFPILILFLWIMFQSTFTLGKYPQHWIEMGVEALSTWLSTILPAGFMADLVIDGIVAGVGGVIIFLPNILILFFFISIMEDTGYMARASFIMDRLMHAIGLHGRSFIPLLTGFGCSVPAIMATRTLENKKDRILTMLVIPFMSCSAKLPVYLLIVSAFFTKGEGLVLLSIYLLGIVMAVIAAKVMSKTIFRKASEQFVLELPPYRKPTLRNTGVHMWDKSVQYLKKMGSVILAASVIIWLLGYFPRHNSQTRTIDHQIEQVIASSQVMTGENSPLDELYAQRTAAQQEGSFIATIGKAVAPVLEPLGFDWKVSVCLLTGFAAKETIVSTMGVLGTAPTPDRPIFPLPVAIALIVFVLFYSPCIATIAACAKESSGKWALFMVIYTTAIAWISALIASNIASLF